MSEKYSKVLIVDSDLGNKEIDSNGAPISGVRIDAFKAYGEIPILLQNYINNNDKSSWKKIVKKIDYIYSNLDYVLEILDNENDLRKKIKSEIKLGKKLLFKPNLVCPNGIDEVTHGEGPGAVICTEWPLIAALMRWFHDKFHIKYYQMAIGEASTSTFILSAFYKKNMGKSITTEAIIEGKSEDFYGGWGFFFVRKYLAYHQTDSSKDDPMKGYEDSVEGRFIPPGKSDDRLMVYDLNKIDENVKRGRTVAVPDGINYKQITLHKVIVGGNPKDDEDLKEYPGCILVNVPKLKMHAQDLLTNAIKNLGIGLYPTKCALESNVGNTSWEYAYPPTSNPSYKGKLPHSPWILKMDENTHLPLKDESGKYIREKTAGFSGTQADVIRAVQSQNVFMFHIVDAINMINLSHDPNGRSVRVPEGYVLASLDCVALDLFCARYCFKTVPMNKALELKEKKGWNTEFVHYVPVAKISEKNIITKKGIDSPLFRYDLYRYSEERGVGTQKYYVRGYDSLTETPMVSYKGHLGSVHDKKFVELMTQTMYYNPATILHHLQKTILSYAKACDKLTGSSLFDEFMNIFDENKDGIIDYDEKGRGIETAQFSMMAYAIDVQINEAYGALKNNFMVLSYYIKNSDKNWNSQGDDFTKESWIVRKAALAYEMSQSENEMEDLFIKEMTFGKGMWPSWQTVNYIITTSTIYGSQSFKNISLKSLYGSAFQYADKALNKGGYTGSIDQMTSDTDSINKYFEAISKGVALLNFTLYVPNGYGSLESMKIPNVEETDDPKKIFTVHFKEEW